MIEVMCDHCKSPLNVSDGVMKYRLTLSCQHLPHVGGITLDVMVYPPIDETKHFCGMGCLHKWVNK